MTMGYLPPRLPVSCLSMAPRFDTKHNASIVARRNPLSELNAQSQAEVRIQNLSFKMFFFYSQYIFLCPKRFTFNCLSAQAGPCLAMLLIQFCDLGHWWISYWNTFSNFWLWLANSPKFCKFHLGDFLIHSVQCTHNKKEELVIYIGFLCLL